MPKGVSCMRDITCADCALVFQGSPQTKRCPKCADARKRQQNLVWRSERKGYVPPCKTVRRYELRRDLTDKVGVFGQIPGTEWVMALRLDEGTPALALQRVPADRMEQWIAQYLRI